MARWTIPTLIQALYDQGADLDLASMVVRDTWPRTQGDTSYRSAGPLINDHHAYGAYGSIMSAKAWHDMIGHDPLRTQASYVATILRLHPDEIASWFDIAGQIDLVATLVAERTVTAIRSGMAIVPEQLPENHRFPERFADLAADMNHARQQAIHVVDMLPGMF